MSAIPETTGFKPKKSVALSGTAAGNTALCTVGLSGNDLHYRGYDILDVATSCEFEEIAHLLVHGHLPNVAELAAYKAPKHVVVVDRVLRSPAGKADYRWALDMAKQALGLG